MKLIKMICPQCGSQLVYDDRLKLATCSYCGTQVYVDDEVKHHQYDNAEETGYKFEKGRQRALKEANATPSKPNKKKIWLWVIGWIVIFPLPLTILLMRNHKMNKKVRIVILVVAWVLYACMMVSAQKEETAQVKPKEVETIPSNQ